MSSFFFSWWGMQNLSPSEETYAGLPRMAIQAIMLNVFRSKIWLWGASCYSYNFISVQKNK